MFEPQTFHEWLAAIDRLVMEKFSLTLSDLPDMMTRHAFDNGETPGEFFEGTVMDVMREEFGDAVDEP